ncbi:lysophospholipid acyltransferase family protein [candidate division KSB1 bacterium]|nr:lysophospholipid acyltransferase family protein [candidate division KSB1 bacterium]
MVKHSIEYRLTLFLSRVARSLSLQTAHHVGDFLGDLFYYVLKIRRNVALENMRSAFSDSKSEQELHAILRQNYQHFGRMIMEFAGMQKMNRSEILNEIPIVNSELIHEKMKLNKGLLLLSAHFGNWEYLAATLANMEYPAYCVFMEQKNKAVDELIKENRMHTGLRPLKIGGGAAKGIFSALRKKGIIVVVMDQDAGKDGAFINFLGRPASTTTGSANIAIRYKTPVLLGFGVRGSNGKIHTELVDFPDINTFSEDETGLHAFLTYYNNTVEKYVRTYPEQYFWMHRRWKTPPSAATERL